MDESIDELEGLKEFTPQLGQRYESKDAKGNWWEITITSENPNGTFCADVDDGFGTKWSKVHKSNCIVLPEKEDPPQTWRKIISPILIDILIWTFIYFAAFTDLLFKDKEPAEGSDHVYESEFILGNTTWTVIWVSILAASLLLRVRHCIARRNVPFGVMPMKTEPHHFGHDVDVYLCGTMHVSPGSIKDTHDTIQAVNPDVIMIELDTERLRDMKQANGSEPEEMYTQELQVNDEVLSGVQAEWNALIPRGDIGPWTLKYEEDNPFGLDKKGPSLNKEAYVCKRGETSFHAKTVVAEKRGASAVIVIDDQEQPLVGLIGTGGLIESFKTLWQVGTVRHPTIPTFLVKDENAKINSGDLISANLKYDRVPPPYSFWKKLCRTCVITCSGIGVLYGVIRWVGVKVGGEFLAADEEARKLDKPLVCIDISIGTLGAKLKEELLPYPRHILKNILWWMSIPRMLLTRILFPLQGLDLPAQMIWAFCRFQIRTWIGFVLAGIVTTLLLSFIISIPGYFVDKAASAGGHEDVGRNFDKFFPLMLEIYIFPAIYWGLLDHRDEKMYRQICSQVRRSYPRGKRTYVAVVGAAHINGILARAKKRGM